MTDTTGTGRSNAGEGISAFIVTGSCNRFRGPAVGVVFTPSQPDMKGLRRMGFENVGSMERVPIAAGANVPNAPTLFLFQRCPQPNATLVAPLSADGSSGGHRTEPLHPHHVVPALEGPIAQRYLKAPGLTVGDFGHPRAHADTATHGHGSKYRRSR